MSSTEKFDVENIVGCLQAILINLPTTDITAKSSTPIMKNISKEIDDMGKEVLNNTTYAD